MRKITKNNLEEVNFDKNVYGFISNTDKEIGIIYECAYRKNPKYNDGYGTEYLLHFKKNNIFANNTSRLLNSIKGCLDYAQIFEFSTSKEFFKWAANHKEKETNG